MLRAMLAASLLLLAAAPLATAAVDPCAKIGGCDDYVNCDSTTSCPFYSVGSDRACAGYRFGTQTTGACALPQAACVVAWVGWSYVPVCPTRSPLVTVLWPILP